MQTLSVLYDRHFQLCFVAFMLRDSDFLAKVAKDVEPEWFSDEGIQRIVRLIKQFYDREGSAPSHLAYREIDKLKEAGKLSDELHKTLNFGLEELFKYQLQNRKTILEEFDRFARHRLISRLILPFREHVDHGRFDEAEELMKQMFTFRPSRQMDLGRRYTTDPTERILRRSKRDEDRYWMLVPEIDRVIPGLQRGQICLFQSQKSSFGKSAALQMLIRSGVFQSKKVLVFTDEMTIDEYEDRLDQCMCGLTSDGLWNGEQIQKDLVRIFSHGGDVWMKEFSSGSATMADLRKTTEMIGSVYNFHPDAIVIDSPDGLSPETKGLKGKMYEKGEEVYQAFSAWVKEEGLYGFGVTQSNKEGMKAATADQEHALGSSAKINISHLVLSINRTADESQNGITRLSVIKNRNGKARFDITIHSDFSRMAFWTYGEE